MNPFDRLPSLPADGYATHEVMNQATPFTGHNAFTGDTLLTEIASREKIGWADGLLAEAGATVASPRVARLARDANRNLPELKSHDRFGHRIDEIEFHPAWHELMSLAIGHGTHALSWTAKEPGAHVARGMLSYLWNQGENGICCPLGMTYSAVPALRLQPELAAVWEPFILSIRYDPTAGPMQGKTGGTVGMTLTEKQAGSDLRATQTTARPAAARRGPGEAYLIDGHKWFFSVPHSDVFVTLAHTDRGLSCFLLPGWLPDGSRNRLLIQRLKDKCGNKSNASSEIEYRGALGWLVGEEGQGIKAALAMTHLTRLDFAIGSAGLMRRALSEAIHHTTGRRAFQRSLIDQPLMQNVIADLALEVEAATLLAFRLARAVDDEQAGDAQRRAAGAHRHAGRQILQLQEGRRRRARGARMPRRQRLHRGRPDGAALSRGAAQRHLGGQRQHHRPRRPARRREVAGERPRLPRRGAAGQRRRPAPRPGDRPPRGRAAPARRA